MEHVECFELLARTHEHDGLAHYRADREGGTTAGITVELGEYHAVEVEAVVKLLGRVHGILTGHGVYHEENLVGGYGLLDGGNLLHHLLVYGKAAGGIHDYHVVVLGLGLADSVLCYLYGVLVALLLVYGHVNLFAQYGELVYSCGAVHVTRCEQRPTVLLALEHEGELTRHGCLTRTLQTAHEDYRGASLELQLHGIATHEGGELIVHDLHHQLAGAYGGEHVLSQCLLLHRVGECLGYLIVDVGIEQCLAHILEGLGHVHFGDFTFTLQYLKRPF